jgi:hypothetical protein
MEGRIGALVSCAGSVPVPSPANKAFFTEPIGDKRHPLCYKIALTKDAELDFSADQPAQGA